MLKVVVIFALIFVVAFAADIQERQFQKWMKKWNKNYSSADEYQLRLQNFKDNMKRSRQLNHKQGQKASFGATKFSDLAHQEFKDKYLMKPFPAQNVCRWPYHRVAPLFSEEKVRDIPSSFDWRTKGAVTAVKDQGGCGSCWTFSTAENIEGQWAIGGNTLTSLSEQWVVDCSHSCLQSEPDLCNGGCGGGLPWLAYEDIITNGFLTTEAAYPYTGEQGTCQSPSQVGAKIGNWTSLSTDPTQIITYMYNNGPLSITLNADMLDAYTGGIITGSPDDCSNDGSDHATLLVGYGIDTTNNNMPYWIVKNSWGLSWGEQGYFRIESDNGLCGINACVTSAMLA